MIEPMTSVIGVRAAVSKDLDWMVAVEKASSPRPWSRASILAELDSEDPGVLAADGGLGFIVYRTVVDEVHVLGVAVDPRFRRRGVATALLQAVLAKGRSNGACLALLEVRRSNGAAWTLYRRHGFRPAAVKRGYYSDSGEDAIVMELTL